MNAQQIEVQLAQLAKMANDIRMSLDITRRNETTKIKRTRAYFYLHVIPAGLEGADKIYRVLGAAGLAEANRIETEFAKHRTGRTERLNAKQFAALVEGRRQAVKHGAAIGFIGALDAVTLTGK